MAYVLEPVVDQWKEKGLGFSLKHAADFCPVANQKWQRWCQTYGISCQLSSVYLPLLGYVDDVVMLSDTLNDLKTMIGNLYHRFASVGMKLNLGKCHWTSSEPLAGQSELKFPQGTVKYAPTIVVLGTCINLQTADNGDALQHRISCAWKCFWANKTFLLEKAAPFKTRIQLLYKTAMVSLLWGSQCWHLTQRQKQHLDTVNLNMVIKIMGMKRKITVAGDLESWVAWQQRIYKEARLLLQELKFDIASRIMFHKIRSWSYHLLRVNPEKSMARAVFMFRPLQWWRIVQAEQRNHGNLRTMPRHPARWRPWRFEEQLPIMWMSLNSHDAE